MSASCTLSDTDLQVNGPGVPYGACGLPSLGVVTFACIHEHVDVADVCATCAVELQRASGLLVCPHCEDGSQPNECLPHVQIEWLDGTPATKVQEASA